MAGFKSGMGAIGRSIGRPVKAEMGNAATIAKEQLFGSAPEQSSNPAQASQNSTTPPPNMGQRQAEESQKRYNVMQYINKIQQQEQYEKQNKSALDQKKFQEKQDDQEKKKVKQFKVDNEKQAMKQQILGAGSAKVERSKKKF